MIHTDHALALVPPYVVTGRPAEARKLLDTLLKEPFGGTTHNGAAIAFIDTALGETQLKKKAAGGS